ncbi:hypothetical protein F0231_09725 [Vibrio sp. RE86]|uniref:protein kinase domain-containing protein n=1 Tax=Vibrio sp. RE86 TaxID=2607605 RepID=UPI001493DE03|nr:AarF/UbiB family protein [Vibrio sp. RE86]NOH80019.1 hypothetical protein [Vibrio sp. RE86]
MRFESLPSVPRHIDACIRALGLTQCSLLGQKVYKAYCATNGWVAIKFALGQREKTLLQRDAEFLSNYSNQHWPRFIAKGAHNNIHWLMMSLIDGTPISVYQDLPPIESLLAKLESILRNVHQTGFIHGDIKPSNIVLQATGELALIDMGSVLPIGTEYQAQQALSVSPRFCSPNALFRYGRTCKADDYFSLAVSAQGLYGSYPFGSGELRTLHQQKKAPNFGALPSRYQVFVHRQIRLAKQLTTAGIC